MKRFNLPIHPWPLGIMLGFSAIFIFHAFVIWIAVSSSNDLVTPEYYEKAVQYDEVLEAHAKTDVSGLSANIEIESLNQTSSVKVFLTGNETVQTSKLQGLLKAYRPSDADKDVELKLKEVQPSLYEVTVPQLQSGLWVFTLTFTQDNQIIYYDTHRMHISQ